MANLQGTTLGGIKFWSYGAPSFTTLVQYLEAGQSTVTETGAMMWMHPTIEIKTAGRKGGVLKGLATSVLGGESFFVNTYTATHGPGEIGCVGASLGDVQPLNVQNTGYLVRSGAFLASEPTINLDTKWQGAKGFFGMRDAIMLHATGQGTMFISSFGAIIERDLLDGEVLLVDNGHVVAFEDRIPYDVRKVGGLKSTLLSGEGLVVEMRGPGRIYLQSRQMAQFAAALVPYLPNNNR